MSTLFNSKVPKNRMSLNPKSKFTLDNTDYRTHEEQQEAIESYVSWRNGERPVSILDWESHCWYAMKVG